mgnify:CR=1 FL=1
MATVTDPRDIILAPVISEKSYGLIENNVYTFVAVSYTHLRAHETVLDLVCRLLLEKKKKKHITHKYK